MTARARWSKSDAAATRLIDESTGLILQVALATADSPRGGIRCRTEGPRDAALPGGADISQLDAGPCRRTRARHAALVLTVVPRGGRRRFPARLRIAAHPVRMT